MASSPRSGSDCRGDGGRALARSRRADRADGLAHRCTDTGCVEQQGGAVERECRLGAFVRVQVFGAEAVAAAAGCEVVERAIKMVTTEEPLERVPGAHAVLGVAGDCEGGELGFDERCGVERLLVAGSWRRLVSPPPTMAGQAQRSVVEAALVAEPAQGVEPDLGQVVAPERTAA